MDSEGEELPSGEIGALVVKLPMPPGASPTLWNADERFREVYLSAFPGYYQTADAGYVDEDGYVFVMSRTDDIINVAGHRLSTGAMEEVLAAHPDVAESAVIGVADELKGQLPVGFLVLKAGVDRPHDEIVAEVVQMVRERIGPVASFKAAVVVERLPKTRSGKILRGTMRRIADGEEYTTPATIDDPATLDEMADALRGIGYASSCTDATRLTQGGPMPLLRGRRDDGGTKYRMREKMFAIGDDYWIENEGGDRAFKVDGKALRIRDTLVIEDPLGLELFTVQEKKLHIRDTMEIERGGQTVATVKKALITRCASVFDRGRGRRRPRGEGERRRPRVQDRARRRQGRRGVEALVPDQGHLRDRSRVRPGRRAHPRGHGVHRPDDARLSRGIGGDRFYRLISPRLPGCRTRTRAPRDGGAPRTRRPTAHGADECERRERRNQTSAAGMREQHERLTSAGGRCTVVPIEERDVPRQVQRRAGAERDRGYPVERLAEVADVV